MAEFVDSIDQEEVQQDEFQAEEVKQQQPEEQQVGRLGRRICSDRRRSRW